MTISKKNTLINELKNSSDDIFNENIENFSSIITSQFKDVIFILTGIHLIENEDYPFNGFQLKEKTKINKLINLKYIFEYGVFECNMPKNKNNSNCFTVIFNDDFVKINNMYKKKIKIDLNDDFKFKVGYINYGIIVLNNEHETRFSSAISIYFTVEIRRKSKQYFIEYSGIDSLRLELNIKENNFYNDFIFLLDNIYKTNQKDEVFNNYPTKIELINDSKKFTKLVNLFVKEYKNNYEKLQMKFDIFRMINI